MAPVHSEFVQKLAFDIKSLFQLTEEQKHQNAIDQEKDLIFAKAVTGGSLMTLPAATAGHSAERLLGTQRIRHGTGPAAAKSILQHGMDPSLGGTGGAAAEGSAAYVRASKGHVHVAVPTVPAGGDATARAYARMLGAKEKGGPVHPLHAFLRSALPGQGDGVVLGGAIPYEDFARDFKIDPDFEPIQGAFKSTKALGAQHLSDSHFGRIKKMVEHRAPDMLGYIKRNPKRFAAGVGLGAATLAAPVAGYHVLKSIKSNTDKLKELKAQKVAAVHGLDLSQDDNSKKSRKGSIPRNVETFLKKAELQGFAEEMQKLSDTDSESDEEVSQAISKLQRPKPWKTIAQTAALAATAAPVIDAAGRFTKGFVDTHGGLGARARGGLGRVATETRGGAGLLGMTMGDIASKGVTSGAGGAVLAAAKEGIELRRARNTLHARLALADDKIAAAVGAGAAIAGPSGPRISLPQAPTLGVLRGSSNKSQRVGNTPIAARSGVTRSQSGEAMNPRANLSDAMKPKV